MRVFQTFLFLILFVSGYLPLAALDFSVRAAEYLCQTAHDRGRTHLAIFPFTNAENEEDDAGAKMATGEITAKLLKCDGVHLIEKMQSQKVLEELAIGQSGLVSSESAPEIGRMIGADALVFGSASPLALQIRLVDAVSGEILGASVVRSEGQKEQVVVSHDVSKQFQEEQIRELLKRTFRSRPGIFLYLTSSDEEIARLGRRNPAIREKMNTSLEKIPTEKRKRIDETRKTVLVHRDQEPRFATHIKELKQKLLERRNLRRQ